MQKRYLGDGVYIRCDGFNIVLTAENGISTTNTIYLDPTTLNKMERYIQELKDLTKKSINYKG